MSQHVQTLKIQNVSFTTLTRRCNTNAADVQQISSLFINYNLLKQGVIYQIISLACFFFDLTQDVEERWLHSVAVECMFSETQHKAAVSV